MLRPWGLGRRAWAVLHRLPRREGGGEGRGEEPASEWRALLC